MLLHYHESHVAVWHKDEILDKEPFVIHRVHPCAFRESEQLIIFAFKALLLIRKIFGFETCHPDLLTKVNHLPVVDSIYISLRIKNDMRVSF